jgi:hypothetical protein
MRLPFLWILFVSCLIDCSAQEFYREIQQTLADHIQVQAEWAMAQEVITITSVECERSAGGRHDYYSEGDYWWPDPANPEGPYIQKDGQSNPYNFNVHRELLIRLSRIVGALGSAYIVTQDDKYVRQALKHAQAWFVDTATAMNPSLNYAQAIKGRVSGRGIGIIDTIHLMEVVQALSKMESSAAMDHALLRDVKTWFAVYLEWLTNHPYGREEMMAKNNHGTCWAMQVASFARFVGNEKLLDDCKTRFKDVILPNQMASDGSFPLELKRTKPYGYSIFNLDAMATLCVILSTPRDNLWRYAIDDKSMKTGIDFLFRYIVDKGSWPFAADVMYWDQWPVAQPFLVFGAIELRNKSWLDAWKRLDHDPGNDEVLRNLPIRNPLLWINR